MHAWHACTCRRMAPSGAAHTPTSTPVSSSSSAAPWLDLAEKVGEIVESLVITAAGGGADTSLCVDTPAPARCTVVSSNTPRQRVVHAPSGGLGQHPGRGCRRRHLVRGPLHAVSRQEVPRKHVLVYVSCHYLTGYTKPQH